MFSSFSSNIREPAGFCASCRMTCPTGSTRPRAEFSPPYFTFHVFNKCKRKVDSCRNAYRGKIQRRAVRESNMRINGHPFATDYRTGIFGNYEAFLGSLSKFAPERYYFLRADKIKFFEPGKIKNPKFISQSLWMFCKCFFSGIAWMQLCTLSFICLQGLFFDLT